MMAAELKPPKRDLHARIFFFLLFTAGITPLWAQNTPIIGLQVERGFLILHSQDIAPIGPSNPYSTGLDISWSLDPTQHYQNCQCFPRLGLSLNYVDLNKPNILGQSLPLYGFLEPHYRIWEQGFFFLRAGMGITYQNRPYHPESNPLNLSYSRHLNTYVELGLGLEYRWNDHWGLRTAFLYNHSSNGGAQEPNKGLNYPTFMIGVNRSLRPLLFPSRREVQQALPPPKRQWDVQLFLAGKAFDQTRVTYAVYGLEISYLHQFNRLSSVDLGLEYVQNDAYRALLNQEGKTLSTSEINLLFGHSFIMGKFTFSQQAGVYLWRGYAPTPDWFQRYGVQYYLWKGWSIGTNIRVHGHVAEFLDARIGYAFPRKKKRLD